MPSVFLSYSHQDRALAERIACDLKKESIAVWLDEWEILIGDSITQRVQEGLNGVDFVIPLLTTHSITSGWTEKEWQSQVGIEAESKRIRILPVKGDVCELPILLRDKKYADVSADYGKGVTDLVVAIRGHSNRSAAKAGEPTHVHEVVQTKGRHRLVRLGEALVILTLLGLVSFVTYRIWYGGPTAYTLNANTTSFYPKSSTIVPPAESYRIRDVLQLPVLDYSGFEILQDRRVVDLRDWKPFDKGAEGRISPVTWSRRVRLRKVAEAGTVRFAFATQGAGIDAACVSGQDYHIESALISCDPPQLLLKTLQVVVNVEQYKVGEEFDLEFQATFWNGTFDEEDWTAYTVNAPAKVVSLMILFPELKAFRWKKLVMYKPGSPDELSPPEDQRAVIYTPDNRNLYWEIRDPIPSNTYEIQWGW